MDSVTADGTQGIRRDWKEKEEEKNLVDESAQEEFDSIVEENVELVESYSGVKAEGRCSSQKR